MKLITNTWYLPNFLYEQMTALKRFLVFFVLFVSFWIPTSIFHLTVTQGIIITSLVFYRGIYLLLSDKIHDKWRSDKLGLVKMVDEHGIVTWKETK